MKKIFITILMATTLFSSDEVMKSLLENVLIKNVQLAIVDSQEMIDKLDKKRVDIKDIRFKFKQLVYSWKKVEATYIGGELDSDFLDLPRYIDIYHEGNENIHKQLARVIKSKDSLDIELFKNSLKTINALEYTLFSNDNLTKREIQIAKRISLNIKSHLKEILNIYKNSSKKLIEDEKFANGAILNALVSSSYKTAMWRVAEGLGKSRKYKNIDKRRFEYSYSKTSLQAIKAIISAHEEIMNGDYDDFGDMALKNGAKNEVESIRDLLTSIKRLISTMSDDNLTTKKGVKLYKELKKLYLNYGLYMIDALSVTAKIIEADGD